MGFWKETRCPMCQKEGAQKFLWMVQCPHYGCPNYNAGLASERSEPLTMDPVKPRLQPKVEHQGSFDPQDYSVTIQYTNHVGESCEFIADWRTLARRRKHISACIMPTGTRCAFAMDKIANLEEIRPYLGKIEVLMKVEQCILTNHLVYGAENPRIPDILEKLA